MKNFKLLILFITLIIAESIAAQEVLEGYLKEAAMNNPGLKARFNEYMAALEVVPQAGALPDPQLMFGLFIQPVETRMGPQRARLSASQMFPWFGTLKSRESAAVQLAEAKYERFAQARSELFYDVKSTYFNLYFTAKAIEITSGNIEILKTFRELAILKVEAGLVSLLDELRVEIEIGELENQLALLNDNFMYMTLVFQNLLNSGDDAPVKIPDLIWNMDYNLSKKEALDSINMMNHELRELYFQQESLNHSKEIASDIGKPSFFVGLDYLVIGKGESNLSGRDGIMFPNLGITVPLYREKYNAMIREANYLSSAKEEESREKSNILENMFENGWKEYTDANRRIELFHSQLSLAGQSLNILETEYSSGNKNFEEVLRMERMLLKFNLELEKARADKQAAIAFLDYLMGQ